MVLSFEGQDVGWVDVQEAYAARVQPIVDAVDALAKERGLPRAAVALAWLLRHPAGIVPLVGSTDPARIRELFDLRSQVYAHQGGAFEADPYPEFHRLRASGPVHEGKIGRAHV